MWDNPRLLNAAAGFLVGLSLLVFGFAAAQAVLRSSLFPIRVVDIVTPPRHVSREALERVVRERVDGNFFAVRLGAMRHALERLPWMRSVDVRRVWPDRLEVVIEEHVALARWGSDGLVDTYGERFAGDGAADLPLFVGPDGSESEVTERYEQFSEILKPLGAPVERVVLTPRYAWQLRLANGLQLMLGRDANIAERRLRRFVDVYDQTVGRVPGPHDYVDLRYADGFALRVKG